MDEAQNNSLQNTAKQLLNINKNAVSHPLKDQLRELQQENALLSARLID